MGTALKTLALRLRGAKVELEEAGLETDNMAESTSTLQAKLKALTHGKVDIMLDADTFKNTTQILREMSDAWEEMTDIEKASALELMGGKRQANILASLIKNFETVEEVIETSSKSSGSALAENEKYLDSIQGKIDQFNNSLQTFWMKTLNSDVVKNVIDLGTAAVDLVGTIGLLPTALAGVLVYFTAIKKNNPVTIFKDLSAQMHNYGLAINRINNIQSGLSTSGISVEEFNTQHIDAYAAAVSNLTNKQQAAALASAGLTNEQIKEAMAKNGVNDANIQQAMSEANIAAAKQQTAFATGIEIVAMAKKNNLALTENSTNWLLKHSTDEVTKSMLAKAVAQGKLSHQEAASILMSMRVVHANKMQTASFKGLKQSILNVIKTNPVGFAIGVGTAIISTISAIKNAVNKLRDETEQTANDAINKYQEVQKTLKSNKVTIEELSQDYAKLAVGVDNLGNNVSLSTSQYERYNEIVNKIADMFPEMVQGYTDEGNAIIKNKGNVEALTKAYKALKQEADNTLLSKAKDIMQTYKYTTEGGFWQWDDSTPDSIKAAKKLEEIFKGKDSYNFDIFGQEYRDEIYDDIIGLLTKSGIKKESMESNSDYVKRAIDEFPGIVQSIINTWESTVNSAISNVKPLVSAYLDQSVGYAGLNNKQKSIIDSIASSFDEEFFNQFDGDASKMYQAIENIVQNIKTSGIEEEYNFVLDAKTSFNGDEISTGEYKKQIDGFVAKLNELKTQGFLSDDDVKYIKLSLDIDENGSDVNAFINHAESLFDNLTDEIKTKISALNYSDLQVINSDLFKVDPGTLSSWDELTEKIEKARIAATQDFDITNFSEAISNHSAVISEYQEAIQKLEKGSFTMDDFMSLIKKYPELAKGVDISSNAFYGLSRNLNKAIRTSTKSFVKDLKELRVTLVAAGKSTDSIDQLIEAIENMPDHALDNVIERYSTLADEIERSRVAQDRLKASMGENPNEGYETRGESLEYMKEAMSKGEIGSESNLWNVAKEYGFTKDTAKLIDAEADSLNDYADALAKYIASREKFFKTEDDGDNRTEDGYSYKGAINFIKAVEGVVKESENAETRLSEILDWNYDESTGTFDFDFDNKNLEEIISLLSKTESLVGLTSSEWMDLMVQVGQFFDVNWGDADDISDYITAIADGSGTAADKIDQMADSVETYVEKTLGTDLDFSSLTDASIDALECDDSIKQLLKTYLSLKQSLEDPLKIEATIGESESVVPLLQIKELKDAITQGQNGYNFINSDIFTDALKEAEYTEEKIQELIEKIKEYQSVIMTTNDDPLGLNSQNTNITSFISSLNILGIEYETVRGELDRPIGINITSNDLIATLKENGWDNDKISSYLQTLSSNAESLGITIDGQVNMTTEQIDEAIAKANEVPEEEHTEYSITGDGLSDLKTINSELNKIPTSKSTNYTITETTVKKTEDKTKFNLFKPSTWADGTAHANGTAYSGGSWGAPETSESLVGELGPEILVRNGRWTTVGENGAEFTQVKKGDIIFNHKQTEQLLKNGYVTSRGRAYAEGTAFASGNSTFSRYEFNGNGGYVEYDVNGNAVDRFKNALNDAAGSVGEFEETIDWIEIRMEEFDERISKLSAEIENLTTYTAKNASIDKIIAENQKKYADALAGAKYYENYAQKYLAGMNNDLIAAAKNGAIAITEFTKEQDEATVKAIQNYRDYAQKAADLYQQAEEILTDIRDSVIQKIDNIQSYGDAKTSIEDLQTERLQNAIDYWETKGVIPASAYYGVNGGNAASSTGMFENSYKKIDYWKPLLEDMQKEFDDAVKSGHIKVGTIEWYEQLEKLYQIQSEIDAANIELEEFQNSVNDLYWENFDELIERLDYIQEETQNLIDLMDNSDMVITPETEDGWTADQVEWTEEGLASLGLYAQQMEIAEYKAKQYAEAIDDLTEEYEAGHYSENEYYEKLNELKDAQYENIEAYYDAQEAIKDLNSTRIDAIKNGIEKELKAREKLIAAKKKELETEKDIDDFRKSTAEQQKNIDAIQRKIDALANDRSSSALAKKKQLEAELAEANYELQESYADRSYENQQNALDKELEDFQATKDAEMAKWDEYLTNIEQIVADSLGVVKANADEIGATLTSKIQEYNLTVSDAILSPWKDGSLAVSDYQDTFDTAISSTTDQLDALKIKWQEVIDKMSEYGKASVEAINKENNDYASATYTPPAVQNQPTNNNNQTQEAKPSLTKGSYIEVKPGTKWYANSYGGGASGPARSGTIKYINTNGSHAYNIEGLGWIKKTDIKGYATGTDSLKKSGIVNIDELGEELILRAKNGRLTYMEKGSGVIPADLTSNLMKWGKLDPTSMLDQNRPSVGVHPEINHTEISIDNSIGELIHIDNCSTETLPDVKKIINEALEKHTQKLNNSIRKYAR